MTRRKVSTSVYLDASQVEGLRELSNRTGAPVAVLVRRGVDRVLEDSKRALISWEQLLTPEILAGLTPAEIIVLANRLGHTIPSLAAVMP